MKMVKKFYEFMMEREAIRMRRLVGLPAPWTEDYILQTYKFTNVKRHDDRTTKILMKRFYAHHEGDNPAVILTNCTLARFLGYAPTLLEIGFVSDWPTQRAYVQQVIETRMARREKVFTGAYIVPNCGDTDAKYLVVLKIVDQVWNFATSTPECVDYANWQNLVQDLCKAVRGMGSFMAKEVVLDFILVTGWIPDDWATWTPIGPGAKRGAARVQTDDGRLDKIPSERVAMEWTRQIYEVRDQYWKAPMACYDGDEFTSYCSTSTIDLELSDIQFQLCEFDKYMRVKHGDGTPRALFVPTGEKK